MIVFVSYQRADTLFAAHALTYALRLGGHDVFVDTGSIPPGDAYRKAIASALARSNVALALVGPTFNVRRLHEPASVVSFEWRSAHFHRVPVVPVLVDGGEMPASGDLPPDLRWFLNSNAPALRRASLSDDIRRCVEQIPEWSAEPRRAARVLWVDDQPSNNEIERRQLRAQGIVFDNVVSSEEARDQLANETYDLVITDLSRWSSSDRSSRAGAAFLGDSARTVRPPVIIYAGSRAVAQRAQLIREGAFEVTDDRAVLIRTVLDLLARAPEPSGDLER